MAVVVQARGPGVGVFVRLKLRLLRNGFRGQTGRKVGFIVGILFGVYLGAIAVLGFLASGTATVEVQRMVAVFAGTVMVVGWALFPLLFFGVDETLDPARFALLPLRRGALTRGMFVAAFIGVPAAATMLASLGLVATAALRFGVVAALTALVGVVAGLSLGIVASRAVTSAFATALRSRRTRDLAIVMIAVLASSIGPLQLLIQSAIVKGNMDQARLALTILSSTPVGAPYALPFDVADGRWATAAAHAAVTLVAFGLLFWWWSRTIESAMLATSTGAAPLPGRARAGGAVAGFMPRLVRGLVRPSVFGAIVACEVRMWWRDPRRRAGLASMLIGVAVVAVALNVAPGRSGPTADASVLRFGFVVTLCGTLAGMLLANQFAYDGNAYAAHVLAQVPGRLQMRARAFAVGIVSLPVQILVVVAVGVLADALDQLPAGLGLLAAAFGVSIAASGLMSVLAPYPLPDTNNPFGMSSGGAGAKGLLALVALVGTVVLCAPMLVVASLLSGTTIGAWVVLVLGLGYGALAARLGAIIAGDRLDRRAPELLATVTPKH